MRSVLRSMVRSEVGIARALWRGLRRAGPDDAGVPVPYAGRFGVVVGAACTLGALEIGVVHVLTPWPAARWVLLAVGGYAVLWVVGLGCSLRQHPHLLREGDLLLRSGHFRSIAVPLDGLAAVRRRVEGGHSRTVVREGDRLAFSVMGDTNVELDLHPPVRLAGEVAPVARVSLWADDPRAAVRLLRGRTGRAAG